MAMEVSSKQLHKHALPIVVMLVGLIIVSAVAIANLNGDNATHGLVAHVVHVKFSNGSAKITLSPSNNTPPNLNQVGQTASDTLDSQ